MRKYIEGAFYMKRKIDQPNPVNEQSSADDLRKILKQYPNIDVRMSIAVHKRIPQDIAMSFARDFNPKVRLALMTNETLLHADFAGKMLKLLANDPIKDVYERAERLVNKA